MKQRKRGVGDVCPLLREMPKPDVVEEHVELPSEEVKLLPKLGTSFEWVVAGCDSETVLVGSIRI